MVWPVGQKHVKEGDVMYYFMSDIHGNAKAYFALKAKIGFSSEDELFILGNIFDGNSAHPEHCLAILDDIMENDNITLILGDHEYAHVLYHMAYEVEVKKELEGRIKRLYPNGQPLLNYMKTLPQEKLDKYISYIVECEMSMLVKMGKRYAYLVYGAPASLDECGGVENWQEIVTSQRIDMNCNYQEAIASDPNNLQGSDWNYDDTIIICGKAPGKDVTDSIPQVKKEQSEGENAAYQKVVFYHNKMLLDCGYRGDETFFTEYLPTLSCAAIEEDGYSVTYYKCDGSDIS